MHTDDTNQPFSIVNAADTIKQRLSDPAIATELVRYPHTSNEDHVDRHSEFWHGNRWNDDIEVRPPMARGRIYDFWMEDFVT